MHLTLRAFSAVAALSAALCLSACGSSDSVSSPNTPVSSAPASTKPATKGPIATPPVATDNSGVLPPAAYDPTQDHPLATEFAIEPYDSYELPPTASGANISVFKASIEDAGPSTIQNTVMDQSPGTPGFRATIRLTNKSDAPVNAAALSYPMLVLDDGTHITGLGDSTNIDENYFTVIEPGESQDVSFIFPTLNNAPEQAEILVRKTDQELETTLKYSNKPTPSQTASPSPEATS